MSKEKVEFDWDESPKGASENEDKKGLSEALKKVVASGISSAFLTEEGIRSYLSDLKLPKDVVAQILGGAKKSRDEIIGKAGNELSRLIRKVDLSAEFRKILVENKISIHAEIDFIPKKKSLKSSDTELLTDDARQTELFES